MQPETLKAIVITVIVVLSLAVIGLAIFAGREFYLVKNPPPTTPPATTKKAPAAAPMMARRAVSNVAGRQQGTAQSSASPDPTPACYNSVLAGTPIVPEDSRNGTLSQASFRSRPQQRASTPIASAHPGRGSALGKPAPVDLSAFAGKGGPTFFGTPAIGGPVELVHAEYLAGHQESRGPSQIIDMRGEPPTLKVGWGNFGTGPEPTTNGVFSELNQYAYAPS